jgi:hypothetical protein
MQRSLPGHCGIILCFDESPRQSVSQGKGFNGQPCFMLAYSYLMNVDIASGNGRLYRGSSDGHYVDIL